MESCRNILKAYIMLFNILFSKFCRLCNNDCLTYLLSLFVYLFPIVPSDDVFLPREDIEVGFSRHKRLLVLSECYRLRFYSLSCYAAG